VEAIEAGSPLPSPVAAPAHRSPPAAGVHRVQFYESDANLIDAAARFVGAGLGAGEGAVVIATDAHRRELDRILTARGLQLRVARAEGRYRTLDARTTLGQLVRDGRPDVALFEKRVGDELAQAAGHGRRAVRVFGEMVALLCADGRPQAAIELEQLWNELARRRPFTLLCAYPLAAFDPPGHEAAFAAVCAEHAEVIPAESYTQLASGNPQRELIAVLQRRSRVLGAEVAQRKRVESALHKALGELQTLYETGRALSAELDLARLLQVLTDAATRLSGARFGAFFSRELDASGDHHVLRTLSGAPRELFEPLGMPRNTELFGPTFAGTGVVRLDDVRRDPRYGRRGPHHGTPPGHLAVTSYLAVPVVARTGEVLGALFLGHPQPGVFTADAERVVVAVAAQAAVALENARLYETERRARTAAETASRAKDEFLAMLGHELRNPLAAVRNAVVAASLDPARRGRALEIARHGLDQLTRLVDDLLDVARLTRGRIKLRVERLALSDILERAIEATRPLIEAQAHSLHAPLPGPELLVEGDSTRLEQVMVNLLTNAAKYTDPGGSISVSASRVDHEAVIRVRDNGIGIAPEMLPRVFDLFAQADRALDRAQGGLGIGLTVVRQLVELHGGRVEAHSDGLGKGAQFTVRLPAGRSAGDAAAGGAPVVSARGDAVHILVVEDNADAAESLQMLLELLGHAVDVARTGPEALERARSRRPDLALVDIGLPGMDGYELARQLRRDPALAPLLLVALTGYGGDDDRRRALEAGFDQHLVKPVRPDVLQHLVMRARPRAP
jgi:signal transduction histidine kinase/ActR/RegA family two-component response regulator